MHDRARPAVRMLWAMQSHGQNLLLLAGLPPSETLGKCGFNNFPEHLFAQVVPMDIYLSTEQRQTPTTMNTKTTSKMYTIYTNGTSLFTLENYSPASGVCHVNGITIHRQVTHGQARRLHANGGLHYVFGIGDSRALKGVGLKRGMSIGAFEVK